MGFLQKFEDISGALGLLLDEAFNIEFPLCVLSCSQIRCEAGCILG